MALSLLQTFWYLSLMVASVCGMVPRKLLDAKLKPSEFDGQKPVDSSILTKLNADVRRQTSPDYTPNIENHQSILKDEQLNDRIARTKSSCLSCSKTKQLLEREEQIKAARLRMMNELLRDKLHIYPEESPDIGTQHNATPIKLPQSILDDTEDKEEEIVEDEYDAWDKQTIQHGQSFVERCPKLHAGACYKFDVSDLLEHRDSIQITVLWVYASNRSQHSRYELVVYELLAYNTSSLGNSQMGLRSIYHSFTSIKDSWIQIDLTEFIFNYLLSDAQTMYLAIACETCFRYHDQHILGTEDGYKPLLITDLFHKPKLRGKRSTQSECDVRTSCCKRQLSFDAAAVGYDNIIRPQILSIGYCSGTCQGLTELTPAYTYFKDWAVKNPNEHNVEGLEFCCVPTQLVDIDVLSWHNGTQRVSTLLKARVESCGCR